MASIITYFLESFFCLFTGWAFYKLLLEKTTFFSWNRAFLLFTLLASIIFPLFNFNIFIPDALPMNSWRGLEASEKFISGNPEIVIQNFFGIQEILGLVYIGGVFWMIGKLVIGIWRTLKMLESSTLSNYRGYKIAVDSKFRPSSFFNYILMPSKEIGSGSFEQIFHHEIMHVKNYHSWDVFLVQLVKGVMWFNPVVYLLEKSLKENHEYQADAGVIAEYSSFSYSRLLVDIASSSEPNWQLMHSFNQFQTKKRIVMMHKEKSERKDLKRFFAGLLVMLSVGMMVSCSSGVDKEDLIGTWRGDDFQFVQSEGPDLVAMIEGGRELHIQSELTLNEDGSYQIMVNGEIINGEGTWEIGEGGTLHTNDGNEVTVYQIIEFSESELVTKHDVAFETPMGKLAGTITQTYKR